MTQLVIWQSHQVDRLAVIVQKNFATDNPARWTGNEPHDAGGGDRFSASRLADDAQRFTFAYFKSHTIDGEHHTGARKEACFQIVHLKHWFDRAQADKRLHFLAYS